eukprot:GILK01012160.1.p1 GENE.GILK01012160.1~~GILK01012160.1.p1  ORF type:complete len:476 (+),score=79.80 GILK01012160.1:17-1444(+)
MGNIDLKSSFSLRRLFVVVVAMFIAEESCPTMRRVFSRATTSSGASSSTKDKLLDQTVAQERKTSLRRGWIQFLRSVVLPENFPHSVTKDYVYYQVWDSLQAFCSSITGMLATQAVLKGVGVGDAEATAASALVQWVIKDGFGMIGSIIFAWQIGGRLDCDAKTWRLAADFFNDLGIMLDLITSALPKSLFLPLICVANLSKAITGVTGGAARASLTRHFALQDNMGDVSAKDGTQEKIVALSGMLFGTFVITSLKDANALWVWFTFSSFTLCHLLCNYMAVCSVVLETINRQRGQIICRHFILHNRVLSMDQVASIEHIFWWESRPFVHMGAPLSMTVRRGETGHAVRETDLEHLISQFSHEEYLLSFRTHRGSPHQCTDIYVTLSQDAKPTDILQAFLHAQYIKYHFTTRTNRRARKGDEEDVESNHADLDRKAIDFVRSRFSEFVNGLERNGWSLARIMIDMKDWRATWKQE